MKTCILTRIYTTKTGAQGVCYLLDGEKGATFLPSHLRGREAIAAWLSTSLGCEVRPANKALASVHTITLTEIAAHVYKPSLEKALAMPREAITRVSPGKRKGELLVEVASSKGKAPYTVTLSSTERNTCTCPHAVHHPHLTCKHAGAVARWLLVHPDIDRTSGDQWMRNFVFIHSAPKGWRSGWVEVAAERNGWIKIKDHQGNTAWRGAHEVMLLDAYTDAAGREFVMVTVPSGDALWDEISPVPEELERLERVA